MPKAEFSVPVRPVQLAEWQVQSHKDILTRTHNRRAVFLRVRDGKDPSSLQANFIDNDKVYHGRGADIFHKEVKIATLAERGFKIVFGKGGSLDRVEPHISLDELITREEQRMDASSNVLAEQIKLRTRKQHMP